MEAPCAPMIAGVHVWGLNASGSADVDRQDGGWFVSGHDNTFTNENFWGNYPEIYGNPQFPLHTAIA